MKIALAASAVVTSGLAGAPHRIPHLRSWPVAIADVGRLIVARPTQKSIFILSSSQELIHQLAEIAEFGQAKALAPLDALGNPAGFEAELGRFLEP